MNLDIKLPKSYYKFADADLNEFDKEKSTELITVNLSSFVSCKLEQLAVHENMPVQDVLKRILIEEGILDEEDVVFSGRKKASSKFLGADCEKLKEIGTSKLYRISLSEYAKAKVLKQMVELGFDLSFFIKKSMVRKSKGSKKFYQVLEVSDIGS